MTEPQVQYARTSDGVSIAFASAGEGPPLIRMMTFGAAHVQRDWAIYPGVCQPLARVFRFIWYDFRGTGLSDRDETDFSMEAMLRDLEAVVDRTGLKSFALLAFMDTVPIATTYAARFPERVSHLILVDGWTNFSDFPGTPTFEAHLALREKDWTLFTETVARVLMGFDDPRLINAFGEHVRACIEPETYLAAMAATRSYDVTALLPDVKAKTLVLHNNNNRWIPTRVGQKLAAGIPDARFLAINDMNYERVAALVEEFAGTIGKPESVEPGAFRTILFTDLVGHTAMMQRLGDAKGREVLREHERITREVLKQYGGTEVKTMGDGFMASFGSVTKAVDCAIALQRAFAEREGEPLSVRVGLNAGEPIEEDGDLFGSTVILASRIAGHAGAGEILIPEPVRHLLSGKPFVYADRGEFVPKGFDDAVRLYEVRWREDEPA
jgi:class 3 adenylate cyclase